MASGLNTRLARLRGRGAKGEGLRAGIPHGHWRTATFLAGPRPSGLDAPMPIDGAMEGRAFLARVRQALIPTLRPGDVVILDTLRAHKGAVIRSDPQ